MYFSQESTVTFVFFELVRIFATIPLGGKECVILIGTAGVALSVIIVLLCKLVINHCKSFTFNATHSDPYLVCLRLWSHPTLPACLATPTYLLCLPIPTLPYLTSTYPSSFPGPLGLARPSQAMVHRTRSATNLQ